MDAGSASTKDKVKVKDVAVEEDVNILAVQMHDACFVI